MRSPLRLWYPLLAMLSTSLSQFMLLATVAETRSSERGCTGAEPQVAAGIFQSTGWPAVMSVMGKWFGKSKRGLIMGIWNAHTSVGNIMGTFMASKLLRSGWGYVHVPT